MNKRNVLLIFLLALLVRLATGWTALRVPAAAWCPDATGYHELAAALWQGRFPSLFRTPGYPLFLALTGAAASEQVVVALLLQMLLDALTAVMLAAIAWRLLQTDMAALLTGLLYAFCPVMAALCGYIVSEPLAIFLVTAAMFLSSFEFRVSGFGFRASGFGFRVNSLFLKLKTQNSKLETTFYRLPTTLRVLRGLFSYRLSVLAQAVLWFAATMVRPSYALLPVLVSFFFLLQPRFSVTLKRQAVMLSLYVVLTGAWIGFNYARAGMPTLSSNPDVSFYIYDTAAVRMIDRLSMGGYVRLALLHPPEFDRALEEQQKAYARAAQVSLNSAAEDLWFTKDDPALIQQFRAEGLKKVAGRLPTLIGIHLTGALQTLRPRWNSAGMFFRFIDGLRMLLLPLAVVMLLWRRQWWFLAFFAVWTGYALLPPGPVGAWRFRALIEPLICLTLASALMIVAQWVQQQTRNLMMNLEADAVERAQQRAMGD